MTKHPSDQRKQHLNSTLDHSDKKPDHFTKADYHSGKRGYHSGKTDYQFDEAKHEEADFRLPISMPFYRRMIFLIIFLAAACLVFLYGSSLYGSFHHGSFFHGQGGPLSNPYRASLFIMVMALSALAVVSAASFLSCLKKGAFTNDLVCSCGTAIFFIYWTALLLMILENKQAAPLKAGSLLETCVFHSLKATAAPALAGILFLILSNIVTISRTGLSENLPSLAFGLLAISGRLLFMATCSLNGPDMIKKLVSLLGPGTGLCILYMETFFLACLVCGLLALRQKPEKAAGYIIIPGCKVWPDGTMSLSLKNRVDTAWLYEKNQYKTTGCHALFLPSGGKGSNRIPSEAQAMKDYLTARGIPENAILVEDRALSTYQNFLYSKELLQARKNQTGKKQANPYIIFCSDNYHLLRCFITADQAGLPVRAIACRPSWYNYANACLREYLALIYINLGCHLVLLAAILAGSTLLSLMQGSL